VNTGAVANSRAVVGILEAPASRLLLFPAIDTPIGVGVVVVLVIRVVILDGSGGDAFAGDPGAVATHTHTLLEVWCEPGCGQIAVTVGTDALHLLLDRHLTEDVQSFRVDYGVFVVFFSG